MSSKRGKVELIEAAYRTDLDETDWMRELARSVPMPAKTMIVVVDLYSINAKGRLQLDHHIDLGSKVDLGPGTKASWEGCPPEYVRETWASTPCAMTAQHGSPATRAETRAAHAVLSEIVGATVRDTFAVNALDPTNRGVYIGCIQSEEGTLSRREVASWTRVAAHLAAGYRLRRSHETQPSDDGEAVVSPSGKLEHATDAVDGAARTSLREAALAIDAARTRRGRANPDEAVEMWQGLVAGRWTLVEHIDRDGRRYYIARKNDPDVQRHHALTRRERQVVAYAALGHSNKLIGYELGLAPSTVAVYLAIAAEKLGLDSRAALIQAARAFGIGGER